jgi:hypothetical protein
MWLMTKYGFFSIASAWQSSTDHTPHPDKLMIRARCKAHLENLKHNFASLQGYTITESQGTDYPFRMIAPKAIIDGVVASLVRGIDYNNFKNEVHETMPNDPAYNSFLMQVWSEGVTMQYDS